MKTTPWLGVICLLLSTSCFKNDSVPESPCYPSGYYEYGSGYSYSESYLYNKANRLTSVSVSYSSTTTPSSSYYRTLTYNYDTDGKLTKISSSDGTSTVYSYTNGRVASITSNSNTNQATSKQEYTYNTNGQLNLRQTYTLVNGTLTKSTYYTYEYADAQTKNFSKRSTFNSSQVLQSTTTYTYDVKTNPNLVLFPFSPTVTSNNILKLVTTPVSGTASTYTYSFSYSERGYPTTGRGGFGTSTADSYSFEYNNCDTY